MLKPRKKCHGYRGLRVAEDANFLPACIPIQSLQYLSAIPNCLLLAKVILWLLLPTFLWNHQQDDWRWYYEKKRWMEVQESCICGTSFRCSSSKARFYCTGIFQPRWMIMWWETELFFQQNVLLCELTAARLQGSPRPEHNWYVSRNKLPDFMTCITQRIKFSFHSSV